MHISDEAVAKVCHEANKTYCETIGDLTQRNWDDASPWQRDSAIKGVRFARYNPTAPVSAQHQSWYNDKAASGWVWGPTKDEVAKTHPCMVDYWALPVEQRYKDALFQGIVRALT